MIMFLVFLFFFPLFTFLDTCQILLNGIHFLEWVKCLSGLGLNLPLSLTSLGLFLNLGAFSVLLPWLALESSFQNTASC